MTAHYIYTTIKNMRTGLGDKQIAAVRQHTGRLLEEIIELNIAAGNTPQEILGHVADALTNEAVKSKRFPSEFNRDLVADLKPEIAYCRILLDYVQGATHISEEELNQAMQFKMEKLTKWFADGILVIRNHCIYRKRSWAG